MHEIQSIENLHTYIKLSNTDGYFSFFTLLLVLHLELYVALQLYVFRHPNITVVAFLSYHIKFRMQSKLMCPYLDKGCIDSKIPAMYYFFVLVQQIVNV